MEVRGSRNGRIWMSAEVDEIRLKPVEGDVEAR